jgi:steroid 5-alpha reductase family enzyme
MLAVLAGVYAAALGGAVAAGLFFAGRSPLFVAAAADFAATVIVFVGSVAANNSSVYDPYWSVAPIPIALYWAFGPVEVPAARRIAIVSLICLWGVRLTYNCLARWRDLHHEDFRYAELRGRMGRAYWPVSFLGVHLMPTIWVFLGLLPVYATLQGSSRPLGWLDGLATIVTASAIAIEALADRQLRHFLAARVDPEAVLNQGLWALSRHPNYFGEVLFWWGLYLFALAAAPGWAWTAIGALSITLLFVFVSVPWMDRRMASRHPAWKAGRR